MKKKFLHFILALLIVPSALALDYTEVILQEELHTPSPQAVSIVETSSDKTLREKLRDVYNLDIEKYDEPNFLLKEILTHKYEENCVLDRTHLWFGYNGDIGLHFNQDNIGQDHITNHYDLNTVNVGLDGFLKNNNADFRVMLNYNPFLTRNFAQNLFNDVYIATNKVPHHRFIIGNTRPPVGVDGGWSPYTLPFIARSQIARNFGSVRKLGARVKGDYSFVDYDLGFYSSDTYFQEFFPGSEFVGWINFKPLAKTNGKYGNLKIGAGIDGGNRNNNFFVTGAYVGYEYKRFMANFEWANANGYNGPIGYSVDKHASGFYTTLGYMLTKKLQLLARYDEFDPNREIANNKQREYSIGLNYFIKGQGLRLILNYVLCQNQNAKDSHRIMLGTQILL